LPDGQHPLDIPLTQFKAKNYGKLRYLIRYLYCLPDRERCTVTKDECDNNQLKLVIPFESDGVELKGYKRTNVIFGWGDKWNDRLAPDINVDNGKLTMKFNFFFNNGQVNFSISDTKFGCKISAESGFAQELLDIINDHWEKDTKKRINSAIQNAVNSQNVQIQTANIWINSLLKSMLMSVQLTLKSVEFMSDKIRFTVSY
jgi:hypothetical protein